MKTIDTAKKTSKEESLIDCETVEELIEIAEDVQHVMIAKLKLRIISCIGEHKTNNVRELVEMLMDLSNTMAASLAIQEPSIEINRYGSKKTD